MKLIHTCPKCSKEHELDSVPEPSQKCHECINFNTFINLVRNQFEYGGQKYAFNDTRESTDVLFDKHGKNWLFGTMDKYTFRYINCAREKDILKIATYCFILWLKRGFFIDNNRINPIDTNIEIKTAQFNKFIKNFEKHISNRKKQEKELIKLEKDYTDLDYIKAISERVQSFSNHYWTSISEYYIFRIFYHTMKIYILKFIDKAGQDTDTYNEGKKEDNNEKSIK